MIRVLVADDQTLIRTAVSELVASEEGLEVVGEASNGEDAINQALELQPDIVLMDVRMPGIDGIAATQSITTHPKLHATHVLILTTFEDDDNVLQALQAGASGFVGKGIEADDLMSAIRVIHAGDALLSPRATSALIAQHLAPASDQLQPWNAALRLLTEREREVLVMVGEGESNAAIADKLFISAATAKTHVNRIMTKLNAHDRVQLVILCYDNGLTRPRAGG